MQNRKRFLGRGLLALWIAGIALVHAKTEPEYDRLDGKGDSGKEVQVIEWEGNLEIHVYPAGSLAGLALKIDRTNKNRPVMVLGYRFTHQPKKTLIRRAILGIPLKDAFHTFRDTSALEYDKIVISNHELSNDLKIYALDPEPKQLYPEGHPALKALAENPANGPAVSPEVANGVTDRLPASAAPQTTPTSVPVDEWGTIKPFRW